MAFGINVVVILLISCTAILSVSAHTKISNGERETSGNDIEGPSKNSKVPAGRPPVKERLFISQTVEDTIERVGKLIKDETIRQIFENCLPSTLDTTVYYHTKRNETNPRAYTYIITGDIKAMWLRDSTYQVNPYVSMARDDPDLRQLILGVINTQTELVNLYPYENAYFPLKHWNSGISLDLSDWSSNNVVRPPYKRDEIFEAKYKLDSLASFLYLEFMHEAYDVNHPDSYSRSWFARANTVFGI